MKKIFFLAISSLLVVGGCNKVDSSSVKISDAEAGITEVYYGTEAALTKSAPYNREEYNHNKTTGCYFFIRVDNTIPDAGSYDSNLYYPQTFNGGSLFDDRANKGLVNTDAEWNYLNSITPKYLFDSKGVTTAKVLTQVPDIQTIIAANRSHKINLDLTNLHVIWYVVKCEDGIWHADGVLTTKDKEDVKDTGAGEKIDEEYNPDKGWKDDGKDKESEKKLNGEVEVDIHHQMHSNWEEIKTSIHIRDTVDVTVKIPLPLMAQKDDVAVRAFYIDPEEWYKATNGEENDLFYENAKEFAAVSITVTHETDNIIIKVNGISSALLKYYREHYHDGFTVEIHSYIKEDAALIPDNIFALIKKAEISTSPKTGLLKTQMGSAFKSEDEWFKNES